MTDQVTDTHNPVPATEPLGLGLSEGLGHNAQDLTGDVAWLWTHCRAMGMTRRSDSGLMRDDVALYTADLHALLRRALPMADALAGGFAYMATVTCPRCGARRKLGAAMVRAGMIECGNRRACDARKAKGHFLHRVSPPNELT